MVTKRFCDRCEKQVPKDGNDNELHFTKQRNSRFGYDKLFHLCEECLEEFDKWLKN